MDWVIDMVDRLFITVAQHRPAEKRIVAYCLHTALNRDGGGGSGGVVVAVVVMVVVVMGLVVVGA